MDNTNTRMTLELTQEFHWLLENLNNETVTRYYDVQKQLEELRRSSTQFKPFFKYPIG